SSDVCSSDLAVHSRTGLAVTRTCEERAGVEHSGRRRGERLDTMQLYSRVPPSSVMTVRPGAGPRRTETSNTVLPKRPEKAHVTPPNSLAAGAGSTAPPNAVANAVPCSPHTAVG